MNFKVLKIPTITFLALVLTFVSCLKNEQDNLSKEELEALIRTNLVNVTTQVKFKKLNSHDFEKIKSGEAVSLNLLLQSNNKNSERLLSNQHNLSKEYINRFGNASYLDLMLKEFMALNPNLELYKGRFNSSKRDGTPCYDQFERDFNLLTIAATTCAAGSAATVWGPLVCAAGYGASVYYILDKFHDCCGC